MVCLWLFNPAGIHFCICGRDLTHFTKWKISTQLLNTVSFPLHFDNATSYFICPHIHAFVSGLKLINFNICICVFSHVWLFEPMDCSPPDSSAHGTVQARILEWVAISFSRGSSQPRDRTRISCMHLLHWQVGSLPLSCWGSPNFF